MFPIVSLTARMLTKTSTPGSNPGGASNLRSRILAKVARLRCQRWPGRNPDRRVRRRVIVPLRRELGVEIFTHVDIARHGVAGHGAREGEPDVVAGPAVGAAEPHRIALDLSDQVSHGEVSLVRAFARSTSPSSFSRGERRRHGLCYKRRPMSLASFGRHSCIIGHPPSYTGGRSGGMYVKSPGVAGFCRNAVVRRLRIRYAF